MNSCNLKHFRIMFPRRVVLLLTLCGYLATVRSQGVFVKVYRNDHRHGDLTEVESTAVDLILRCESPVDPTEWVNDYDITNITSRRFPCAPSEWNERWSSSEGYLNQSFVHLTCAKFESTLAMGCRSVSNHSDNIMVKLEPNETTDRLHITKHPGAWEGYEKPDSTHCVQFTLAKTRHGNYWKCGGPSGNRGKVHIWYSGTSQSCANLQRKLKLQPVCVNLTDQWNVGDQGWQTMDMDVFGTHPCGVVTCELDSGNPRGAAVEYFLAGKDRSTLHFSLTEISMSDQIWFDPVPTPTTTIYTKDKFEPLCKTSKYGLAWEPRLSVMLNGTTLMSEVATSSNVDTKDSTYTRQIVINFEEEGFGPGAYEVVCSAPVWNTSEWASQTLKFDVHNVVPPHFVSDHEHVIVNQDDANVRLHCDVQGDPEPDITWTHSAVPGILVDGRELILTSVEDKWVNGSTVSCTSGNKFGQQATKKFSMQVRLADGPGRSDSSNSIGTVLPSMVVGTILFAVALGFAALYWRFLKLGRAVTQVLSDEEMKEFQRWKAAPPDTGIDDRLVIY